MSFASPSNVVYYFRLMSDPPYAFILPLVNKHIRQPHCTLLFKCGRHFPETASLIVSLLAVQMIHLVLVLILSSFAQGAS